MLTSNRLWTLWIAAAAVIGWYWYTDPDGGAQTIQRLQYLSWAIVAAGPVYVLRRAFFPEARSKDAYRHAMTSGTGAGLVFLGLAIVVAAFFLALTGRAMAQSSTYIPLLRAELAAHWQVSHGAIVAGQIEHETCSSKRFCWNPRAELKTEREYGFGLGQLTITKSFDNFKAAKALHVSLKDWNFSDRFDAIRQLRTMVLMDRNLYDRLSIKEVNERTAMMLAAYNGGFGGLDADRRLCGRIEGCNNQKWFGHVEQHSIKSRTKQGGYGRSFYDINREYVRRIVFDRSRKYVEHF